VGVLQTALGVVLRANTQILLHPVVPDRGHLTDRQVTADEVSFYLPPEDDVEVVGQLVGLDPDEIVVVHAVCGLVERVGLRLDPEVVLDDRGEQSPER
jgi:hypothetical protein